jgi:hypothetical protein
LCGDIQMASLGESRPRLRASQTYPRAEGTAGTLCARAPSRRTRAGFF